MYYTTSRLIHFCTSLQRELTSKRKYSHSIKVIFDKPFESSVILKHFQCLLFPILGKISLHKHDRDQRILHRSPSPSLKIIKCQIYTHFFVVCKYLVDRYYQKSYIGQKWGGDFEKFCGLLRIYEFYHRITQKSCNAGHINFINGLWTHKG